MGQGMQRKVDKTNSWRSWALAASLTLAPFSLTANDQKADFFWQGSNLHATPAALTYKELLTAQASTTASGQRRVQVGSRDTLWSIARANRPSRDITIKQAMLAIQEANPRSFSSGNINEMESGFWLTIPSAEAMRSRSPQQAEEEVRRQNQAWVASRAPHHPSQGPRTSASEPPSATQPEPASATTATRAPVETAPALQLTARETSDEQQALISELETRLESSEDALHSVEREKDELAARISEMQEQLDTLQQLLRLKDEQLDELESQLAAGEAAQPPAPQVQPSPPRVASQPTIEELLRQPLVMGAVAGLLVALFLALLALISARRKLATNLKEQAAADEARRREEELHSLTDSNAQSDDFDRDLNAQPLANLDELDDYEDLDLGDDLTEVSDITEEATAEEEAPAERDPLKEAEMFIAYGRLEQAAGFLQKAIAEHPQREDLRVKLLEVLVELNDEETFNSQRKQLDAQKPSASSKKRAEELAALLSQSQAAAAGAATAGAAAAVAADEEAHAEELGELDLGEGLDDLDLDDIFGADEAEEPAAAEATEMDFSGLDQLEVASEETPAEQDSSLEFEESDSAEDDLADLDDIFGAEETDDLAAEAEGDKAPVDQDSSSQLEEADSADDFADLEDIFGADEAEESKAAEGAEDDFGDLDQLEADLDEVLSEKEPLPPREEEDLTDDLADLEELGEEEAESLDLELDLEKPLAADEISNDSSDIQDFEPVDYQSETDDFMSALDEINQEEAAEEPLSDEPYRSPEVDEELSAFTEDLSGLTGEQPQTEQAFDAADDLVDLESLQLGDSSEASVNEDLSRLDDLADLGDELDFSADEGDMNTQLDLATAYIEMGDQEGAREILEKVAVEGDADQKATAQQMLGSLNN